MDYALVAGSLVTLYLVVRITHWYLFGREE